MEMKTKIGAFDPQTRQVPVTFTAGAVKHERHVNAVVDTAGAYDKAATKERVAQVAQGVAVKIEAGAFREPAPIASAPDTPAD